MPDGSGCCKGWHIKKSDLERRKASLIGQLGLDSNTNTFYHQLKWDFVFTLNI